MHNYNNNHTIQGNIGQTPETRTVPSGDTVVTFSVGVNKKWTDKNKTTHERTDWFNVEVWGPMTKLASNLAKGAPVLVTGEGRTGSYTKDAVEHRTYTIRANYIRRIDYSKTTAIEEIEQDDSEQAPF